jgi:hypothetical protein
LFFHHADLADRLRNLAFAHTNVKGLEAHLEMAHHHYQASIFSFAKDLEVSITYHGRQNPFWVESGLCTSQEDADTLFATVDSVLAGLKNPVPGEFAKEMYAAHGRFLNVLAHLHGEAPVTVSVVPEAPTFASKNAAYANSTFIDIPKVPAAKAKASAAKTPADPSLTQASASPSKGKGKQKETTPDPSVFFIDMPSPIMELD